MFKNSKVRRSITLAKIASLWQPPASPHESQNDTALMKTATQKKRWIKPSLKDVPIFFECTCYAGSR